MNRLTVFGLAALALACSGLAAAQTATATDSADMAASGMHGKRMKHTGEMKKGGAGKHEASDQNTARSSGASASATKGAPMGSAIAASAASSVRR